ncbi:MAG: trimethylamine methyltransferase family protein [Butyricicoccus sp.]|nr:trimethylamine methyltransferase family protein [Butyricicoccus sp.]
MMSKEQMIHNAAMEIMQDVGVAFHNEDALQILKDNGIRVEGEIAYFTEEQVMHWVKMAPSSFTLYGRNSKYDTFVGGEQVNPHPAYGCAFIAERDGTQRPGVLADYIKAVRLVHASDAYTMNGGIIIQPNDVPDRTSAADMFYAALVNSDKVMMLPTTDKDVAEAIMQAGCEVFGGMEGMIEKPRFFTLINTNSPLALEGRMLDNLMVFAKYGQAVIVCPASMLGATSPLSMAGTLASNAAETLAGIVLAQMVRPGTPVVYGVQSNAVDMKGVTFACGAPEGAAMQAFGAKMAKFYDLPSRGGGSQTDAPTVNAQAGYESMLTFFSAYKAGINMVLEAGGVVASVNATSFDKMIVDFEIIRQVKRACEPIEINEEMLCMDDIKELAHTGSFLTTDFTLDYFMDLLYYPNIGSRNAKTPTYFEDSIDAEMERLLDEYEDNRPTLDEETRARVKAALVNGCGIDIEQLNTIDRL